MPDPDWKEKTVGEVWTIGDTYNFGIGQGYVAATPIQMALVTAAIANGGDVLVPHVVQRDHGRRRQGHRGPERQTSSATSTSTRATSTSCARACARPSTTAPPPPHRCAASRSPARPVRPSSASATPDGTIREHGWFTGFAPFNNPEIAVVVFLEQGNGAITAAPVGGQDLRLLLQPQEPGGGRADDQLTRGRPVRLSAADTVAWP